MKLRILLSPLLCLLVAGCLSHPEAKKLSVHVGIASPEAIDPYGSVNLDIPSSDLLNHGFLWGDEVSVQVNDQALTMPLLPHYRLVAPGDPVLVVWKKEDRPARLAVLYGSFAERFGIADKSSGPAWKAHPGVEFPLDVTITLLRTGAYAANVNLLDLRRTNVRADYATLSDDDFANFRAVSAPRLRPNVLFRSSSPIQTELERNGYVDAACRREGIKTVVNMADAENDARAARGFPNSYVSAQTVLYKPMGVDFSSPDFGQDLADSLRFLAEHEPPYLLHCKEGQDRTGFICAILECYFGAMIDDVEEDYLRTFRNFYGVLPGSPAESALRDTFYRILTRAFNKFGFSDLSASAQAYLQSIGLTDADLTALKGKLEAN